MGLALRDLCQWAAGADDTEPVDTIPLEEARRPPATPTASSWFSASAGWLALGSCPVRFEGDSGWVEAGDSGKLALSSPALLAGKKVAEIGGYPATYHIRDFLNCVKSRAQPRANAEVACHSHIACHAANIAIFLGRKLRYDPKLNVFLNDPEANRFAARPCAIPGRGKTKRAPEVGWAE